MKRLIYLFFLVFSFVFFSFSFAASTSITTKDASLIKINTATLNANVDSFYDSTNGAEYWFEYGTSNNNFSFKTAVTKTTSTGNVTANITGLSPFSTYYFRACAKDSVSVACSSVKNFITYKNPAVSISSASNVTDVTAKISGAITDLGGSGVTVSYWFEYGIGASYASKVSSTVKTATTVGNIDLDVSSLKSDSTYYYRFCAKTDFTSSNICSNDSAFATNKTIVAPTDTRAPIVKNISYEFTSQNSAKLKARLDNLGTFSSLNYYFEYGTNLNYGNSINESKNLTVVSDFSSELKNLTYGVTYYFRACVKDVVNVDNKYCSDPSYFTVVDYKNLPIDVGSSTVSDIKDKSVRINSTINGFGGNEEIGVYANITDSNFKNFQTPQTRVPFTSRNFSILVENLSPNNVYKYSICYYTSTKVNCSSTINTFTTLRNVVIGKVSSIVSADKINLIANISDIGTTESNYPNTKTWFAYTLDSNFKNNIVLTNKNAFSKSDITEIVSGLKKDTKYYYKFCANNGLDDVCSDVSDFTIPSVAPVDPNIKDPSVMPSNFLKLSSSSVKIFVNVASFGGDVSTLNYISYGEKEDSLKNTDNVSCSDVGSEINFTISGLSENKKYYYKVCSKNSVKTYCTQSFSFSLFKSQGSGAFLKIPKDFKVTKLDVKFSEKLRGKILTQTQNKNDLWYVNPVNLRRYYLGNYSNAYNVFKAIAVSISDKDFATFKNSKATAAYTGKIIYKASDPITLYYVSPKDYRMWYFVNQSEAEFIIKKNTEPISNANLLKVDYYDLSDMVYNNIEKKDTDGDTLYDDLEINVYGTNPYYLDTDGDGYPDNIEIQKGFNPLIKGK